MENIIIILIGVLVAAGLYYKSNMLSVLGMLAFGWVLVYVTNNEAILFARSLSPVGGNNIDIVTSLFLGFGPAISAVFLTRNASKKPFIRLFGLLLAPSMVIIGWLIALLAVSYETRAKLLDTEVNNIVYDYQEYVLWLGTIIVILYLYFTKPKQSKEDKKK